MLKQLSISFLSSLQLQIHNEHIKSTANGNKGFRARSHTYPGARYITITFSGPTTKIIGVHSAEGRNIVRAAASAHEEFRRDGRNRERAKKDGKKGCPGSNGGFREKELC